MEKKECKFCERVWAAFGIALGLVFLYISVDIATGGRVTSTLTRSREVTDNDAAE